MTTAAIKPKTWDVVLSADYISGLGGSWDIQSDPSNKRYTHCESLFGSPLYGTMNFHVNRGLFDKVRKLLRPTKQGFWTVNSIIQPVLFYPCSIVSGQDETVCWFVETKHIERKGPGTHCVELLSRRTVPKKFLKSGVKLVFHSRWPETKIDEWWPSQCKWFQSFWWGPQRADSQLVWDTIRRQTTWSNKRVLDIGCSTGWYSFKASSCGSIVDAADTSTKMAHLAKTINNNIEMSDVDVYESDPGGKYDTILYLSVHHSSDTHYTHLAETLASLRLRCKDLFVEIHSPPPHSDVTEADVDKIMKLKPLMRYQHKVRGVRNVYHLVGTA